MSSRNKDEYLALSRLEASAFSLSALIMGLVDPREEHQANRTDLCQTGEVLEKPLSLRERDILRFPISLGCEKGSKPSHSQCLKAFLKETNPILVDIVDEDDELKKTKKRVMKILVSRLYDAARHLVRRLKAEIVSNNSIPDNVLWKNLPPTEKQAYCDLFENLAKNAGIGLDRCIGHWGAHMLLADRFHDTNSPVVKNTNGVSQRLNTMLNKTAERAITTTVNPVSTDENSSTANNVISVSTDENPSTANIYHVSTDENPSIANIYSVSTDENPSTANTVISVSDS